MLAQRNVSAKISAIDINEDAVKLAPKILKFSFFGKIKSYFKILKL
jgi:methylase of polypeptide subunit release factors